MFEPITIPNHPYSVIPAKAGIQFLNANSALNLGN